jgi:hypothetical protein
MLREEPKKITIFIGFFVEVKLYEEKKQQAIISTGNSDAACCQGL